MQDFPEAFAASPGETVEHRLARRQAFQQAYLAGYVRTSYVPRDKARGVWALSTGKAGTTTLARLLSLSESVLSYHEPSPRLWHLGYDAYRDRCASAWWGRLVWAARRELVSLAAEGGYLYSETSGRMSYFAPAIAGALPRSRFIYVWRDLDSYTRSAWRWGNYTEQDRALEGRLVPHQPGPQDRGAVIAWSWLATNCYILDLLEHLPRERSFAIALADLDADAALRLFDWLEVDAPSRADIDHVLARKHNPSPAPEVEVPKTWGTYDAPALAVYERARALAGREH